MRVEVVEPTWALHLLFVQLVVLELTLIRFSVKDAINMLDACFVTLVGIWDEAFGHRDDAARA